MKKILIIVVIMLVGVTYCSITNNKSLKADNERLIFNLKNTGQEIEQQINKNNELSYMVNSLTVKSNELEFYNNNLKQEINNLNIKIKNLQAVTQIEYKYIYNTDTLYIENNGQQHFRVNNIDEWVNINLDIHTSEPVESITANNLNLNLNDTLTTAYEVKYKGWWFWKRATGVKLHIKNNNPYHQLDKVETYQIKY